MRQYPPTPDDHAGLRELEERDRNHRPPPMSENRGSASHRESAPPPGTEMRAAKPDSPTSDARVAAARQLPADMPRDPSFIVHLAQTAWKAVSPRAKLSDELADLDAQVGDLARRQSEVQAQLADRSADLIGAPATDADRLATWQLGGESGPRPEPQAPAIEEHIERLKADAHGLERAIERVHDDRARYIEENRGSLVRLADERADAAHSALAASITAVEDARDELVHARADAVLLSLHPESVAAHPVAHSQMAGGIARLLRKAGLDHAVQVASILGLLRDDATWLRTAATSEQRALLEGRDPRDKGATWSDTAEGRAGDRAERQAALRRYRETWGVDPA